MKKKILFVYLLAVLILISYGYAEEVRVVQVQYGQVKIGSRVISMGVVKKHYPKASLFLDLNLKKHKKNITQKVNSELFISFTKMTKFANFSESDLKVGDKILVDGFYFTLPTDSDVRIGIPPGIRGYYITKLPHDAEFVVKDGKYIFPSPHDSKKSDEWMTLLHGSGKDKLKLLMNSNVPQERAAGVYLALRDTLPDRYSNFNYNIHKINTITEYSVGGISVKLAGESLTSVNIPVSISNELITFAKSSGYKYEFEIDLTFVTWLSQILYDYNVINGKNEGERALQVAYLLTNAIKHGYFEATKELVTTFVKAL